MMKWKRLEDSRAPRKNIPWSSKSSIWNASKLEKTNVEKATTWSFFFSVGVKRIKYGTMMSSAAPLFL